MTQAALPSNSIVSVMMTCPAGAAVAKRSQHYAVLSSASPPTSRPEQQSL
jgi:hypothetical protein